MRISPITTQNTNNPQFKRLKISNPEHWNQRVLNDVVNNPEIRAYAAKMERMGKDLSLAYRDYSTGTKSILFSHNNFITCSEFANSSSDEGLIRQMSYFRSGSTPSNGLNDEMMW